MNTRLKLLPPPFANTLPLDALERLPGHWRGRADTRLKFAAEATDWQERLRHLAAAAEYERREKRARNIGD
jgi:hypothetical protein